MKNMNNLNEVNTLIKKQILLHSATHCVHEMNFTYKDTERQSKRTEENIPCRCKSAWLY